MADAICTMPQVMLQTDLCFATMYLLSVVQLLPLPERDRRGRVHMGKVTSPSQVNTETHKTNGHTHIQT